MDELKKPKRIIQVNDINIGTNIKSIREQAKLTQTEVVKELQLSGIEISIYSYNRIEKGTQNPTVSFLLAICKIFNCSINQIVC